MTDKTQYFSPIKNINIYNFRNIKNLSLSPGSRLNIIYGNNAQGKTNLIEAIWMFTGERSFRKAKESQLILFGEKTAKLNLDFVANNRPQNAIIKWTPQKNIYLNKYKINMITDFIGVFSAIVFSPEDLNLVKGGPERRRNFLDIALSQIRSRYSKLLLEYNKILSQRNALLKDIFRHPSLNETLDIWDQVFSKIAAQIIRYRLKYINVLLPVAKEIYHGISHQKEDLEIKYISSDDFDFNISYDDLYQYFLKKLIKVRNLDVKFGFSQIGPHRDDLKITINNFFAKNFASQGQQRSIVLTLKLAEAQILKDIANKNPVILLDDVMSELDINRKKYILNFLKDSQCFITCCDESEFKNCDSETSLFEINKLIQTL